MRTTHSFEENDAWLNNIQTQAHRLVRAGIVEIESELEIVVGFQSSKLDSCFKAPRFTVQDDSLDPYFLPNEKFDSQRVVSFLPDRYQSVFNQPLPIGTVPNWTLLANGTSIENGSYKEFTNPQTNTTGIMSNPIVADLIASFNVMPDDLHHLSRWWNYYRHKATVVYLPDGSILSAGETIPPAAANLFAAELNQYKLDWLLYYRQFDPTFITQFDLHGSLPALDSARDPYLYYMTSTGYDRYQTLNNLDSSQAVSNGVDFAQSQVDGTFTRVSGRLDSRGKSSTIELDCYFYTELDCPDINATTLGV
jgi:hypothetical protein